MNKEDFLQFLAKSGLPEPVLVEWESGSMKEHDHPFEARGFIVSGSITLNVAGVETEYVSGDVFHLLPHQKHAESYGAQGVQYLVSRKQTS